MKKFITLILCLISCFATAILSFGCENPNDDYLRIHIRANSDSADDQEIKLTVRDGVVGYLSPYLSKAKTRKEAEEIILSKKSELENSIDELLYSCGYLYGCELVLDEEYFEEKSYGDLTLPAGYYRAIIVNLGTGKGKNWWCVAFPPLCFTLGEDYKNANYKSILYEIIKKYHEEGK